MVRPLRIAGIESRRKCTSGCSFRRSRRRSHARKPPITARPAAITNGVNENPNGSIGELRGCSQPQVLASSTPNTTSASPSAHSTAPTRSSSAPGCPLSFGSRRTASRIAITTSTSPTNTIRHVRFVVTQPPKIGPTAIPAPETPPSTP